MDDEYTGSTVNVWVTGGLLGCELMIIGYMLHHVLTSQMPESLCKTLDETLRDTHSFLDEVAGQGLLPDTRYIADIRRELAR